jgi:hypothetical protein
LKSLKQKFLIHNFTMPTLQQLYYLEISPEKFISKCSEVELQEIILLANARLRRDEASPAAPEPAPLSVAAPVKARPKTRSNAWTPEEDALIRKLYPTTPTKTLAEQMNYRRSTHSIVQHANTIGVSKEPIAQCNTWTPEEDALIRELYPTTSAKALSEKMNHRRSPDAIYRQAIALGIRKNKKSRLPTYGRPSAPVREATPPPAPPKRATKPAGDLEQAGGFSVHEEITSLREQALRVLEKAKAAEAAKRLVTVRIDRRTLLQVPAGKDVETWKGKYNKLS